VINKDTACALAQKNTLSEGHVFAAQGVFVDGFYQLDPKQLNHETGKEKSRNDRYLKEYREERSA